MIPTLFGVMAITFAVTQFVPGGPVEKMISSIQGYGGADQEVGGGSSIYRGNVGLDDERLQQLRKLYGFDEPPLKRFLVMMKNYFMFDFGVSYNFV